MTSPSCEEHDSSNTEAFRLHTPGMRGARQQHHRSISPQTSGMRGARQQHHRSISPQTSGMRGARQQHHRSISPSHLRHARSTTAAPPKHFAFTPPACEEPDSNILEALILNEAILKLNDFSFMRGARQEHHRSISPQTSGMRGARQQHHRSISPSHLRHARSTTAAYLKLSS